MLGLASGTSRCADEIRVGSFTRSDVVGAGGTASNDGGTQGCVIRECQSHKYACGDCLDNDDDGLIDSEDPDCLGPCQNSEDSFFSAIPGGTSDRCTQDCYFDQDTGAGNDQCLWSRTCDPLEVAPAFDPVGSACPYDPTGTIQQLGGTHTCNELEQTQAAACSEVCGPLTPNGCDCFGCCTIEGAATPVWIGSTDDLGNPTCDLEHIADPTRCRPCTQVPSCLNTCDHCELCVGKTSLPADCAGNDGGTLQCPAGVAACGLPDQPPCDAGSYCVTGCCAPLVH